MSQSPTENAAEDARETPPLTANEVVGNEATTDTAGSKKDRKSHTPASMSRTQLPPTATPEERASLEKLKQKMDFTDDTSQKSPSTTPPLSPQPQLNDDSPVVVKKPENGDVSEGEIDTSASVSHVLSRLDQVRHYMEEANSLYEAFQAQESLEPSDQAQMLKLSTLIKHFKEQELGYLTLLQRIMNFEQDTGDEDTATDLNTTRDTLASSLQSSSDVDDHQPMLSASAPTLPVTARHVAANNDSLSLQSELDKSRAATASETDLTQEEELAVLKEQHALLSRLLHQQNELRQLEARQANLLALKQEAEVTLASARKEMHEQTEQLESRPLVDYDHTSSNSEDDNEEPQIVELETGMAGMSMDENTGPQSLSELVDEEAEKAALMTKLDDLETRKARIDQLLTQLHTLQSAESEAATAMLPPPVAAVSSDDWLSSIDDPALRERIRQLQIRRSDQQLQQAVVGEEEEEEYETPEAVQQSYGPSEIVDIAPGEKALEEKMKKLEEAREQLKRLQGAISSYQDMMSTEDGDSNQAEDEANEDHLDKSMVADYQERLSRQRLEVNELLQQREALLRTQKMMRELNEGAATATFGAHKKSSHGRPTAMAPAAAAAVAPQRVNPYDNQLSVELLRQKQLYDDLVKKTQLLHQLQTSVTAGSEHDTYSVTSSMRGVSTVEGGGDMTMATWGGSTAQSVDTTGVQSGEEQYDEDYEADTTLQHTGDSAALEESDHGTYTVDDVPFRVDRHTPRRRILTPDSGMTRNADKKIKLDNQPRATKFTVPQEQDPASKYSNPEWAARPVSPRRKYRSSEHEMQLQQQLASSTNMCNDLIRSQLQLVDVLTYRLSTQTPAYPLGLVQYYDGYHQQLMEYHAHLYDVYQKTQQSMSQQPQQGDQSATEQPLDSNQNARYTASGQDANMAPGYPFAEGSASSLYANPPQYPPSFAAGQSNNASFSMPGHPLNVPPPPAPFQNAHLSQFPPYDARFGPYNTPLLARASGVTPQHSYPWSPLRSYTSPMRPFEMPPPFRGSPVFHFGRTPPYGSGVGPQFDVQPPHTSQPATVYPPQSPSGVTAASAQAVAPSTPSARSASTLLQQQDLSGNQDQGGSTLESASHFMPASSANLFHPFTSSQPTSASVSFGVPTVANMTRKNKGTSYAVTTSTGSAGLTAAVHVASGQTNLEEADSESSMPCSLPDDVTNKYAHAGTAKDPAAAAAIGEDDVAEEFSLFEALRDSIYSEVATLISNNESRPHYLIELFRELQLLKTDYLRQRALYSVQDLVTRFLTEESLAEDSTNMYQHWVESGTDQTPSDSLVTSDDELSKGKFPQASHSTHDYSEPAESATTLSTPPLEPFASDNLGDTVIHLDFSKAQSRDKDQALSSNTDDNSDSSKSDAFSTENISTQALDQQIKNIMIEVIPLLKNHLQSPCSSEFLASVQQFIMNLALKEEDQQIEYVQIFTTQLSETLTKTLAKYSGKLLKDCGEELLIDVSEVLFNEMAFLKLMEDVANHPDADMLGLPLAQVVEAKSPEKSCTAAVLQSLASTAMKQLHFEEEQLGKDRDDDMAKQCQFPTAGEQSVVTEVESSVNESQPLNSSDGDDGKAVGEETQDEEVAKTDTEEDTNLSNTDTAAAANSTINDTDQTSSTGNNDELVNSGDPDNSTQTDKASPTTVDKENVAPVAVTNLDQATLEAKMEQEQKTTTGLAGVLASMSTDTVLAGDGETIKEPTETEP